jgi:hypothetical protein
VDSKGDKDFKSLMSKNWKKKTFFRGATFTLGKEEGRNGA